MAHNSLGSSQVDRLTTTTSVVYLTPSRAARTTYSPGYNSIHSHAHGTLCFHGTPTWIMTLFKLENPILRYMHTHAVNYDALIIYLQHIEAVRKEELDRHPSCCYRVTFHSPGQTQDFSPRLTFCVLSEINSRMKYYTFPRRGNLTQHTSPLLSYIGGFLQTLYQ